MYIFTFQHHLILHLPSHLKLDTDINCLWLFFSTSIAKLHYEWQLYPHQEQKYTNIQTWRALMFFSNIFFTFDDLLIQITDTRWSDLVPANNKHNTHFTNGKTIYIILYRCYAYFYEIFILFIWRFNIILYVAQVRIYGLRSTDNHLTTYVVIEGNIASRTILPPLQIYCHTFFPVYDINFICLLFVIIFSTTTHTSLTFPLHLKYYIWSSLLHYFHVCK